ASVSIVVIVPITARAQMTAGMVAVIVIIVPITVVDPATTGVAAIRAGVAMEDFGVADVAPDGGTRDGDHDIAPRVSSGLIAVVDAPDVTGTPVATTGVIVVAVSVMGLGRVASQTADGQPQAHP